MASTINTEHDGVVCTFSTSHPRLWSYGAYQKYTAYILSPEFCKRQDGSVNIKSQKVSKQWYWISHRRIVLKFDRCLGNSRDPAARCWPRVRSGKCLGSLAARMPTKFRSDQLTLAHISLFSQSVELVERCLTAQYIKAQIPKSESPGFKISRELVVRRLTAQCIEAQNLRIILTFSFFGGFLFSG